MKLTVTKVRYADDLGVPQAAKIDGRYVVVFAKVTGTDEKRSVPMYDALRDLLRIEQVPGVTAPSARTRSRAATACAPTPSWWPTTPSRWATWPPA